MSQKPDWIIHLVCNGAPCEVCGKVEDSFLPYACNAHTHGMSRYGHMDFQMVLRCSTNEIGRILNTLGARVRGGERFSAGDMVTGIYDDCSVRLDEYEECERKVLRVIIPDKYNRFPEDPDCMEPYTLQRLETDDLQKKGGGCTCG